MNDKDPQKDQDTVTSLEDIEVVPTQEPVAQEDFKDKWLRALSEMANAQKRFDKEKEETATFAITKFAKDLLVVADNLQRALDAAKNTEDPLYQGVDLTAKELEKVLAKFGVTKVPALHQIFDPHLHQAMLEEPSKDHPENTVLSVLQEGYMLHQRLLRPALVTVSKQPVAE